MRVECVANQRIFFKYKYATLWNDLPVIKAIKLKVINGEIVTCFIRTKINCLYAKNSPSNKQLSNTQQRHNNPIYNLFMIKHGLSLVESPFFVKLSKFYA